MVANRVFWSAVCIALLLSALSGCTTDVACTNCRAGERLEDGVTPAGSTAEPEPDADPEPDVDLDPEAEPDAEPEPSPGPEPDTGAPAAEPYGNCIQETRVCQHGEAPRCLVDDAEHVTMAFCTSSCSSTQECPRAPQGSEAQPNCLPLTEKGECVLECVAGQDCPRDMVCLPFGVCGYVTEEAQNPYDRCDACPNDWCLSFNTGEVCLPACRGECPSARSGDAVPHCIEMEGRFGCAIECELPFACPDGMVCERVGSRSLCLWAHEDPCNELDCGRDADCQILGGSPQCVCEPGLVPDSRGGCVHPCANVSCHPTAYCETIGTEAVCLCPQGETMDAEGRCDEAAEPDVNPCDPNPCQPPASSCVEVDGAAYCDCPDPTAVPPDCGPQPECTTHLDGDPLEPNDCPEDATLLAAGSAVFGPSRIPVDFGPTLDDVDHYRLAPQAGVYWVLLDAPAPVCDLDFVLLPDDEAFGGFERGVQLRADEQGAPFPCRYDAGLGGLTDYTLGVLHFPFLADLPASTTPDGQGGTPTVPGYFEVMDRFEGEDDVDSFRVRAELPVWLGFTGQRSVVQVEVFDESGQSTALLETECGFALESTACLDVTGSELVTLVIRVTRSTLAEQTELDAWRIGLLRRTDTAPAE